MKQYKYPGIYTISNNIDGKMYIGKAVNIHTRMSQHRLYLKKNKHSNEHLQRAWNKYGESAFKFELLVKCEEEHLYSEEHYWCNMLNVHNEEIGYNIVKFAGRTDGYKHDEVTKKKMSEHWKKKWNSMTEDEKNKSVLRTSKSRLGMKNSKSHMKAIIDSMSIGINSPENLAKRSRPVIKYSLNGDFIEEYPSLAKARDSVTNKKSISPIKYACLNFNRKS